MATTPLDRRLRSENVGSVVNSAVSFNAKAQRGKPQPKDLTRSKQSKRRKTRPDAKKRVLFLSVSSVSSHENA